jgi:ABC-type enterobactin transport system permease subunit
MMSRTNNGEKLRRALTGRAWLVWVVLLVLAVLLTAAAAQFAYFPGDVALTNFVQSLNGENVNWAQTVTNTVRTPSILCAGGA